MKTSSLILSYGLFSFALGCAATSLSACSAVTPADRAAAYAVFAKDHKFKCAAYNFDVSSGLSPVVPEMAESCD